MRTMVKYFHNATKEWVTGIEIQEKLDKGCRFVCNDCGTIIGEHLAVFAKGIFCSKCRDKIMQDIMNDGIEELTKIIDEEFA